MDRAAGARAPDHCDLCVSGSSSLGEQHHRTGNSQFDSGWTIVADRRICRPTYGAKPGLTPQQRLHHLELLLPPLPVRSSSSSAASTAWADAPALGEGKGVVEKCSCIGWVAKLEGYMHSTIQRGG